ncbi:MAG: hypothetical protein HYR84_12830 [Planctomycetes bacterium]|nr:hypothetical protein [Planctomycetota bacterium]
MGCTSRQLALAIIAAIWPLSALHAQGPRPLSPQVRAEWEKAGFEVGWMARDDGGSGFSFRPAKDAAKPGELLAFRCNPWRPGALAKLQPPGQAFGFYLRNTMTDAGLKELAGLEHLQALDLVLSEVTDVGLKELAHIPHLQTLDVRMIPNVTNAGLKELAHCKKLQTLYMDATNATAAELDDLNAASALPVLAFRSRVTGEGLKEIASLKQLQSLHLLYIQGTDADYQHLMNLPRLQSLSLCGCKMTDGTGFGQLAQFKELHTLNFTFARLTPTGLKRLAAIESMRSLNFYYTLVADAELAAMAEVEQLHSLRLSGTAVTGKGVKELGRLKNLNALYLDRTKWTDAGMKEIAWLRNLQTLDLRRTAVSSKGLSELGRLKNLRYLDVRSTAVNDASVLQQALPSLRIER